VQWAKADDRFLGILRSRRYDLVCVPFTGR
jgi:hypothetical protein